MTDGTDNDARVFAVDTRFQKMARRPGGVSRQEAINGAQNRLQEIAPDFNSWLDDELKRLTEAVQRLGDANADADSIAAVNAHCYQLQNIGTTMNCELITFVAGCLCDVLDAIAAGGKCDMANIRCHLDALLLAGQRKYRHMKPEQVPQLTAGLRRLVAQASTPTSS